MTAREAFLGRVRQAVRDGNQAGAAPALPQRGAIGYQGAGAAGMVAKFCTELTNAGGVPHVVPDADEAVVCMRRIIDECQARRIVIGRGEFLDGLDLARQLRLPGLEPMLLDKNLWRRDDFFASDLGISGVEYLVAETGTVVVASSPDESRSLSLLPPIHIAVAHRSQILPDLFDLFDAFAPTGNHPRTPPSCLSLITGPSKTGDIELKLVTGVHGPGQVHVVVVGSMNHPS